MGEVVLIHPFPFWIFTAAACAIVTLLALFLTLGTYDRKEHVTGYLEPDLGLAKVYAETPGIAIEARTREGDLVKQDDLLFTISTRRNTLQSGDVDSLIVTELEKSQRNYAEQLTHQGHLSELERQDLANRIEGLSAETIQVKQEIQVRETQYQATRERLDSLAELLGKHFISQDQFKDHQERTLNAQLLTQESKRLLIDKESQLKEARNLLAQLPMKAALSKAALEQSMVEMNQKLAEIKARRVYTVRAPVAGRVTAQTTQAGQSVKTDIPLLAILPENASLQAQLFVPTRAIGFVAPGQRVLLQYSAFPYQRFGLHQGEIAQVTETVLAPNELPIPVALNEAVYRVTVRPRKQTVAAYGREIPLQAGMLLNADIVLERRTLGQWLLDPLYSLTGRL